MTEARLAAAGDNEQLKVLEADPTLLAAIPAEHRKTARERLLAVSLSVEPGLWDSDELNEPGALGVLVTEGLLTRNVDIAGTRSREILGPGDVIRPWEDDAALNPVPSRTTWTILERSRLALLDRRFRLVAGRWPEFGMEILNRMVRRARWLAVLLAIANLRGVEERAFLLLWHVAGNWGRVTSRGTLVPFGLTHELIAELIGARRPSVTTALKKMEREGKLRRVDKGWLLLVGPPSTVD
jgi:CRP/FNR family transcriptional regulator, cyclic AMP receptor protein